MAAVFAVTSFAFLTGGGPAHATQAALPRHGYTTIANGHSDKAVAWALGLRARRAPCLRLSLAPTGSSRRPQPRAWDCFMDYSTDVAIYTDCATDETYLYGPTSTHAVRVLVVYNYGRVRRGLVRRAPSPRTRAAYLVHVSHARQVHHVRLYAHGGRLLGDLSVGFAYVCSSR